MRKLHYDPPEIHLSSLVQLLEDNNQYLNINIDYDIYTDKIIYYKHDCIFSVLVELPRPTFLPDINDIVFSFAADTYCQYAVKIIWDVMTNYFHGNIHLKLQHTHLYIKKHYMCNNIKISNITLDEAALDVMTNNLSHLAFDQVTFKDHYNKSAFNISEYKKHDCDAIEAYSFTENKVQSNKFSSTIPQCRPPYSMFNIDMHDLQYHIYSYIYDCIYSPLFVKLGHYRVDQSYCRTDHSDNRLYTRLQQECSTHLSGQRLFNELKKYYFSTITINHMLQHTTHNQNKPDKAYITKLPLDVWHVITDYCHPFFGNQIKKIIHEIQTSGNNADIETIDAHGDL